MSISRVRAIVLPLALAGCGAIAVGLAAQSSNSNVAAVPAADQNPAASAASAGAQAQAPAFPNLPLWAYPVNPGRGGFGGGARGGGNRGGAANAGGNSGGANPGGNGAAAGRGPGRAPDDGSLRHVPGSDVGLTQTQMRSNGMFGFPDWFPDAHPGMPDIVLKGNSTSGVQACGYCHLPNGQGRPENESLVGLPAGYIVQQLSDFKSGLRKGSDPRMGYFWMVRIGTAISEEDAWTAAKYFASLTPKPWIRVVETDTVPVTRPAGGMLVAVEGQTEPKIGRAHV